MPRSVELQELDECLDADWMPVYAMKALMAWAESIEQRLEALEGGEK